jgi:small ligand-binding sensory domain FIST
MARFPYAHVSGDNWPDLCARAGAEIGSAPPGAALGFVYLSDTLGKDLDEIITCLRERTGVAHWAGSVGMGVCSTGRECYEPSLAIMVTDIREDQLCVIPPSDQEVARFLDTSRDWRERHAGLFAVVHGDPSNPRITQLVEALADGLGNGFLVGGLTSSNGAQLQAADRAVSGGISGVLLSSAVPVATGLTQGCSLIGNPHVITACQANIIETIDDRPALDVFREEIGDVLSRNLNAVAGYIFAALPIPASDTGDYLVRNLLGIDQQQGLLAIGDRVAPGTAIQFARRDAETARDDLRRMIRALKHRLPGEPRGALYHTCLGRGRYLFGENSAELSVVRDELGDVPLVGFYANGEISHRRLYGYTGVLTVFC